MYSSKDEEITFLHEFIFVFILYFIVAILSKRVQAVRWRVRKKKKKRRGVSHIGEGGGIYRRLENFKPSAYYEGILSHFSFLSKYIFYGLKNVKKCFNRKFHIWLEWHINILIKCLYIICHTWKGMWNIYMTKEGRGRWQSILQTWTQPISIVFSSFSSVQKKLQLVIFKFEIFYAIHSQ